MTRMVIWHFKKKNLRTSFKWQAGKVEKNLVNVINLFLLDEVKEGRILQAVKVRVYRNAF